VNTNAEDHAFDALKYLLFGLLGRQLSHLVPTQRRAGLARPESSGMMQRAL
jgi:hypothetical protein